MRSGSGVDALNRRERPVQVIEMPSSIGAYECCFELIVLCTLAPKVFHVVGWLMSPAKSRSLSHTLRIQAFEIFFCFRLAMED